MSQPREGLAVRALISTRTCDCTHFERTRYPVQNTLFGGLERAQDPTASLRGWSGRRGGSSARSFLNKSGSSSPDQFLQPGLSRSVSLLGQYERADHRQSLSSCRPVSTLPRLDRFVLQSAPY